jgi:hypothetical protein
MLTERYAAEVFPMLEPTSAFAGGLTGSIDVLNFHFSSLLAGRQHQAM